MQDEAQRPLDEPIEERRPPARPERLHLDYVDSVRALAALYVVLCHAYYEPAGGYYASRLMNRLGLTYGPQAVAIFIVVSGFCLMLPIAQRGSFGSPATFFKRRVRRILPPYYAAIALGVVFTALFAREATGTIWDICRPFHWRSLLNHVFLLQTIPWLQYLPSGAHLPQINYPLWSIAVEMHIYFLMPALVFALFRFGKAPLLIGAMTTALALEGMFGRQLRDLRYWYVALFAMGMVSAHECIQGRVQRWWGPVALGLGLSVATFIVLAGRTRTITFTMPVDFCVGGMTALGLGALLQDSKEKRLWLSRFLAWKPLVTLGLFSYSLYLVHAPLLHACWLFWNWALHPSPVPMFLLLVASIPAIIGAAYLFFLVFERPFLNARPKPKP